MFYVIELAILALFILFIITKVLVPLFRGGSRSSLKRAKRLAKEARMRREAAAQELQAARIESEAESMEAQAEEIRLKEFERLTRE